MDQSLLSHLLALAARTGDRIIVVDPATRAPFVLMGLPQYEALQQSVTHADERGWSADGRGSRGDVVGPTETMSIGGIAPGADPMALRGNAELAALRAETPMEIPVPETTPGVSSPVTIVTGYVPEPTQPAPARDEDRFYVEPLE